MTMTVGQSIIMIAAIILATVLTRFLPFIIFGGGRPIPDFVNYLGKVLPFAVTGMLVVYSLKDAPFNAWHGLPEFICAAITLALHFLAPQHAYKHCWRNGSLYVFNTKNILT